MVERDQSFLQLILDKQINRQTEGQTDNSINFKERNCINVIRSAVYTAFQLYAFLRCNTNIGKRCLYRG